MKAAFAVALVALVVAPALGPGDAEAQSFLECRNGTAYRDGAPAQVKCRARNGVGVSIDVGPSEFAYRDSPPCGSTPPDRAVRELLAAAVAQRGSTRSADASAFAEFWSRLRARVSNLGEVGDLVAGVSRGRAGSRCQAFVVPVVVPPQKIRGVEFRANQQGRQGACFTAQPLSPSGPQASTRSGGGGASGLQPPAGACTVGWSGWEGGALVADGQGGTVVGAIFKNWSHNLRRTAEMWVWY